MLISSVSEKTSLSLSIKWADSFQRMFRGWFYTNFILSKELSGIFGAFV